MSLTFKRVVAYIIDIIIVSLVSSLISANSYINKDYNKYMDTIDEYSKEYDNYKEKIESLKQELTDKKINEDSYNSQVNELDEEFKDKDINYNYKLVKLSIITLFYFVVIQFYFNGKTLGKKIMKIKVLSNNGKNLTIFNFFIRCLLLNGVFINTLSIIFLIS